MSLSKVQHQAIDEGFFDLLGADKSDLNEVKFKDTALTLEALAAMYIDKLIEKLEAADAASSGRLSDSLKPTNVTIDGTKYSIGIQAASYASFVDEGVNGWAVNRGSRFQFRQGKRGKHTGGITPFVKSLMEWLAREGSSARNVKVGISHREKRGKRIESAEVKEAVKVAFFIRRKGLKPTNFWRDATKEMQIVIEKEMGEAVKIDIINFLNK